MKIRDFPHTDTLLIEFRESIVAATRDLDEDTQLDVDALGTGVKSPSSTLRHVPACPDDHRKE